MEAGQLNRRVRIERRTGARDAAGQGPVAWETFATVWANIKTGSGADAIKADQLTSSVRASICIRHNATIAANMRAIDIGSGAIYSIKAVQHELQDGEWTYLVCETGAARA